ncbi:MAG: TIGR02147 family protein [Proteobacteria bacterium]|nr:MAG: TIGR02147 family protein [Pseudomonadota bacterium]
MNTTELGYRKYILDEFVTRRTRNPSYSLRAFARDLQIPASRLSEIMSGKAGVSETRALDLIDKLKLDNASRDRFLDLFRSAHSRIQQIKMEASRNLEINRLDQNVIEEDRFALIADWQHLAILEVLKVENLEKTPEQIGGRLGVHPVLVSESIERLQRLGFLEDGETGIVPKNEGGTTTHDVPSAAIRQYHQQLLDKAKEAIESKPIDERDFSSVVFAIDKTKVAAAKEKIRNFRREFMREFETGGTPDSVYGMSVQFFELTETL